MYVDTGPDKTIIFGGRRGLMVLALDFSAEGRPFKYPHGTKNKFLFLAMGSHAFTLFSILLLYGLIKSTSSQH